MDASLLMNGMHGTEGVIPQVTYHVRDGHHADLRLAQELNYSSLCVASCPPPCIVRNHDVSRAGRSRHSHKGVEDDDEMG